MRYTHLPITFLKSLLYEGRREKREKGGRVILSFLHSPTAAPFPLWLPPGHPPRGVVKGKRPTVSPMGLVENVLLKGLLLLDTGVGVVIVLVRGKETGWAVRAGSAG